MSPTERRRPITRRKRLAHMGVGGVLAAVAGSQAGVVLADAHNEPSPQADPPVATVEHAPLMEPVVLTRPYRSRPTRHRAHVRQQQRATSVVTPIWTALAQCESSGNWRDTAGTYEGGVQFLNSTWLAYGGGDYAQHAYDATAEEQVTVARKLLKADGPGPWPVCGPKVGLTRANGLA